MLDYWRLLVHKCSRCTCAWKRNQNNEVSEHHRARKPKNNKTKTANYKVTRQKRTQKKWTGHTQRHLLTRNCKSGEETAFKLCLKLPHQIEKKAVCKEDRHTWNLLKVIYCWTDNLLELLESIITTREVKDKSNRDMMRTRTHTRTHTGVQMVLLVVASHISSIVMWGQTEDSDYISDIMHERKSTDVWMVRKKSYTTTSGADSF